MPRARRSSVTTFGNRTAAGDLPKKKICKKGIVFVFSHDEFPSYEQRQGRERDEDRIKQHFSETLDYDVEEPFVNLTADEVRNKAEEAAADKKLENYDSVVVIVISQFDVIGKYLAKSNHYKEDDIIQRFVASSPLVLKPKIFIFQASKAKKIPVIMGRSLNHVQVDGNQESVSYTLPEEANLFIVRSSLPYMTENSGTWFIDEVCNHLIGQLPLHDEIVKVLRSTNEKRTIEPSSILVPFLPDVTSTLVYKLFLSYKKTNPVDHSLEAYNRGKRNGCLFIFNYDESFNEAKYVFEKREGTQNDVKKMEDTFKRLDFDVVVENNLSRSDLLRRLESATCEEDENNRRGRYFSSDMCVIVAVFTHGYDGKLGTADRNLDPIDLFNEVNAKADLRGKPKIFILQVCRGTVLSQGVYITGNVDTDATNEEDLATYDDQLVTDAGRASACYDSYTTPNDVPETNKDNPLLRIDDMIVLHSAYQGKAALRSQRNGTWLIQELCAEINRKTPNYNEASLTDIFTELQRQIALKKFGNSKQMPVYTSTLTKNVIIGKRTTD